MALAESNLRSRHYAIWVIMKIIVEVFNNSDMIVRGESVFWKITSLTVFMIKTSFESFGISFWSNFTEDWLYQPICLGLTTNILEISSLRCPYLIKIDWTVFDVQGFIFRTEDSGAVTGVLPFTTHCYSHHPCGKVKVSKHCSDTCGWDKIKIFVDFASP